MVLKNGFIKYSVLSIALSLGVGNSVSASNDWDENYSDGVQIAINVYSQESFELSGAIRVNVNETPSLENFPYASTLFLPTVNVGNLRVWEPLDPAFFPHEAPPFEPWYPFGDDIPNPFEFGPRLGPSPGDAQIYPPFPVPFQRFSPWGTAFIELPGMGIWGYFELPEGSVKKIAKFKYEVKFDTCELNIPGDQCGLIEFTVKPNGLHTSRFKGTRVDRLNHGNSNSGAARTFKFKGTFVEKTASVEGSVFGFEIFPGVAGVISTHDITNKVKTFSSND